MIPQNFSLLGFAVSEELGIKQTNTETHSLTDWRFDRVMMKNYYHIFDIKCINDIKLQICNMSSFSKFSTIIVEIKLDPLFLDTNGSNHGESSLKFCRS